MITAKKIYKSSVLGIEVEDLRVIREAQEDALGDLFDKSKHNLTGAQIQLVTDTIKSNFTRIREIYGEMMDCSTFRD